MKILKLLIVLLIVLIPVAVLAENQQTVMYQVDFTSTWSQATHPHSSGSLPGSAHYSPLIGGSHNSDVVFWEDGALASDGMERMAENGWTCPLCDEIDAAITAGDAYAVITGGALGSATGTVTTNITMHTDYPLVTLVTMIAPSPDWFVGTNGVSLQGPGGTWLPSVTVDLYPWDAGTDSGTDYSSGNQDTVPADPIASAWNVYPFSDQPMGTYTFTLITPTSVGLNTISAGTNPLLPLLLALLVLVAVTAKTTNFNIR